MERCKFFSINQLLKKINSIYCNYPRGLNIIVFVMIKFKLIRLFTILNNIFLEVYIFNGKEKNSGVDISVLICSNKEKLHYLPNRLFIDGYSVKKIGKYPIWKINKLIEYNHKKIDLVFLNVDRFLKDFLEKNGLFIIPEWVNMIVDTTKSLSEIHDNFSRGAKKDIKKIEKYDYTYEVTKDPEKLKNFYNNMFLPYMLNRHGENILNTYLRFVKQLIKKDSVLLLKEGDKYICGGLIEVKRKNAILPSMGLLNSDVRLLTKCAISALYYFHIIFAKNNNIKSLNYGDTRPFLNDGGFQFKRKWGMNLVLSKFEHGVFGFQICKYNDASKSFLMNNPFIIINKNQLRGLVYNHKTTPTTSSEIRQYIKSYYTPGLSEFFIISPNGFTEECKFFFPSEKYLPKNFIQEISQFKLNNQTLETYKIKIRK